MKDWRGAVRWDAGIIHAETRAEAEALVFSAFVKAVKDKGWFKTVEIDLTCIGSTDVEKHTLPYRNLL